MAQKAPSIQSTSNDPRHGTSSTGGAGAGEDSAAAEIGMGLVGSLAKTSRVQVDQAVMVREEYHACQWRR